jgi:type IV secretion system protein VirB1
VRAPVRKALRDVARGRGWPTCVHPTTAQALIDVESSRNPHAISLVGGALLRQPVSADEAVTTARQQQASGWDYSAGLAQINRRNFQRLGLDERSIFTATNIAWTAK